MASENNSDLDQALSTIAEFRQEQSSFVTKLDVLYRMVDEVNSILSNVDPDDAFVKTCFSGTSPIRSRNEVLKQLTRTTPGSTLWNATDMRFCNDDVVTWFAEFVLKGSANEYYLAKKSVADTELATRYHAFFKECNADGCSRPAQCTDVPKVYTTVVAGIAAAMRILSVWDLIKGDEIIVDTEIEHVVCARTLAHVLRMYQDTDLYNSYAEVFRRAMHMVFGEYTRVNFVLDKSEYRNTSYWDMRDSIQALQQAVSLVADEGELETRFEVPDVSTRESLALLFFPSKIKDFTDFVCRCVHIATTVYKTDIGLRFKLLECLVWSFFDCDAMQSRDTLQP